MPLSPDQVKKYIEQPAFTDPPVSSRATRMTVPQDVWRSLEMVPGLITWGIILGSIILSLFVPRVVAYAILLFDVYWLVKSVTMSHSLIRAYRYLKRDTKVDWQARLKQLDRSIDTYAGTLERIISRIDGGRKNISRMLWNVRLMILNRPLQQDYRELKVELEEVENVIESATDGAPLLHPRDIYQLVIVATYTEELDTLRPSFQALADSKFDKDRMIVVLATEERDRDRAQANTKVIQSEFGKRFKKLIVTEHPSNITGEVKGKGSNIAWAGRQAVKEIDRLGIPHQNVIVTTLDADHRPHPQYLAALTYHYVLDPERKYRSFQPTPLFHNNLWHTTAINRVIATGNSFWHMVESTRAYRLRNFAAHSQGLETVIDSDYWSVDTIVEDGQQFWRTYFRYHGNHYVQPVYVPVYQDAVLDDTYLATLRAQYLQLRRWAWGSSDFPYIVVNSVRDKEIPWANKGAQIIRFLEGHVTWASAAILITFVGWLPVVLSPTFRETLFGQTLAPTASLILTAALVGMIVTVFISMLLLPEKPPGYKAHHRVAMLLQWALLPVTTIFFSAIPAIESQTRLMFGKYLEFWVTPKSSRSKGRVSQPTERRA
ncbi:glycosyltransferase family 2 protein [Patescibacteria group bacterium]|nr:glycosyltransferase family 2 protein [Patescibacteria group bacterium]